MMTNSYLEFFLTLLGWVINNAVWDILVSSGLFVVPLIFKLAGIWLKVREEGEDEGNKGMLSLPRMEHALYGAFFVMITCCLPLFKVSLLNLTFDTSRARTCGSWVPEDPNDTRFLDVITSLNGQVAHAPLWWALIHRVSKGVTQASVASIPCRPDLRQVRFEVQHTRLANPALAEELQDFTRDCYSLSLYMWKRNDQGNTTDKTQLRDIEWLGSKTFLNNRGYYDDLFSENPRRAFPYQLPRDEGRPDTGRGGYPSCRDWWQAKDVGLEARVINQASEGMWARLGIALKMMGKYDPDYREAVIRRLVSPTSLQVSQSGNAYMGYGGNADFTLSNAAVRLLSLGGTALGSIAAFPAFDAMRQALPMVQAILLMAIYVMLPLIIAFGVYEFKTVITLTFVIFALNFLTFWWELARWLDSWLLEALYSSETHSRFNLMGFQNTTDDVIMNLVMGSMFLMLPMFWVAAFSWAGIKIGDTVYNATKNGSADAQQAGGKGAEAVKMMVAKK